MNKALKYTLIIVAAIFVLVIAAVAIIAFTFDPNAYRAKIQELVKEKTGRTLTLAGDIGLTFFPSLGVKLGQASLSERKSAETFASVENARISMELLPLLRQELVVDATKIEGLRANVVRDKNGSFNFDDLLPKEEKQDEQAAPMRFDIDGVELTNSALSYRDLATGAHYQITNLNLDTGGIALGRETPIKLAFHLNANQPKVDLDAKLDTRLSFHFNPQRVQFQNLDVSVKGSAAEFQKLDLSLKGSGEAHPATQELSLAKLNLALAGVRAGENVDVKLEIPQLKLTQKAVAGENVVLDARLASKEGSTTAYLAVPRITGDANSFQIGPLALNANVKRGEDAITAKLTAPLSGRFEKGGMKPATLSSSEAVVELGGKMGGNAFQGSLTSPLSVNVLEQQIELPKLALRASLSGNDLPAKEISAQLAGSATAHLKKEQAQLNVSGTVDQSKLQGRFGVTGFAKPAISFEAEMDQLNLNRYMAADAKKPQAEKQTKPAQGEPEKPFDLSALKDLNANGTLKIGSLTAADLKASQVTLTLRAANGKVQLDPLAANLYQGRMTGAASVNAASTPMFALKQNLHGIAVGPLLKDIAEKDLLEGKGNVSLDVAAQGATLSAIKQTLNGTAALKLEDGALNGINIAQSIRSAKAQVAALRGEAAPTSTGPQKTDFSELSASFAIKNGIAHNDDLSIKSPLLRIGGSGDVNIPAEKLDYLMKATVVATSKGQGGAELEALKGLTVPVKIFGPLDSPEYKLDLSGLATQAAQQKLEEKKEDLKARAQEKIQERLFGKQGQDAQKKEGSEQRLQDALKGILK